MRNPEIEKYLELDSLKTLLLMIEHNHSLSKEFAKIKDTYHYLLPGEAILVFKNENPEYPAMLDRLEFRKIVLTEEMSREYNIQSSENF